MLFQEKERKGKERGTFSGLPLNLMLTEVCPLETVWCDRQVSFNPLDDAFGVGCNVCKNP